MVVAIVVFVIVVFVVVFVIVVFVIVVFVVIFVVVALISSTMHNIFLTVNTHNEFTPPPLDILSSWLIVVLLYLLG